MSKIKFGVKTLDAIPTPEKQIIVWDSDLIGYGVRVSPKGAKTLFFQGRIADGDGKIIKTTIGRVGQISVDAARKKAKDIAAKMANGIDPRAEKKQAPKATFGEMLDGYIEYLISKDKKDWRPVKNAIHRDIKAAHPRLWKKPADQIDIDDCVKIVGALVDAGKLRQADKVRSYIRTAFSEAIKARGNSQAPAALRTMRIKYNPARDMSIVEGSNNVDKRVLEMDEFRALWRRIKQLPEPDRSIAMLYILTGGQRQRQLIRTTLSDVDHTSSTLRLLDPKGRRTKAYQHTVPLIPEAMDCIRRLTGSGEYIFSKNGGISPSPSPMRDSFNKLCLDMAKAGELRNASVIEVKDDDDNTKEIVTNKFTPKNIRATVETRLSEYVNSDVLARLLSHGLGGVQNRHYNAHEYQAEKLNAIKLLVSLLEGDSFDDEKITGIGTAKVV